MGERDSGGVDLVAAFVLGAMVGAGLALLLAPEPDEKTRKVIGKRGRRWRKRAEKQVRETGTEWAGEAEERIQEWTREIADAVANGVETIRDTVSTELKGLEKKLGGKKGLFH